MNHKDYLRHLDDYIFNSGQMNQTGLNKKIADLYKDMVSSHYKSALQKMFPRLSEVFEIPWEEWGSLYKTKYGQSAWELNSLTREFPQFLEENQLVPDYLIELSEYELAEFFVFTKLTESESIINETLEILYLNYDIANYVISLEKGMLDAQPEKIQNILGINRDPDTLLCIFSSLNILDLDIIETVQLEEINKDMLIKSLLSKYEIMGATETLIHERLKYLNDQKILKENI